MINESVSTKKTVFNLHSQPMTEYKTEIPEAINKKLRMENKTNASFVKAMLTVKHGVN